MKRKEIKRKEAEQRNNEWAKLTPEQQLKELEKRPGNSAKQRKKLATKA